MKNDWTFDDPPNTACFTTTFVLDGSPILRVYRDYDGDWLVQETDDDGNYVGVLSNDPRHDAAENGDVVHFHPLHIADMG